MVFASRAGKGEGTSDPERSYVEELHDDEYDENWFRIGWDGPEYEDAWIMVRAEHREYLYDNE